MGDSLRESHDMGMRAPGRKGTGSPHTVDTRSPRVIVGPTASHRLPLLFPIETAAMSSTAAPRRTVVANAVYGLLNPIPFGCFVAALIFDILYARTAELLWDKGAAWLITFGLLIAVVPRLVNLAQVWITSRQTASHTDRIDFWLNLFAIVAAIFNAFVHSRDAYAVVPASVWLSICTVILLSIAHIVVAVHHSASGDRP
jgi:uncharacterized membrane protein